MATYDFINVVNDKTICIKPLDNYHPALWSILDVAIAPAPEVRNVTYIDFKTANFAAINLFLNSVN